MDLLLKNEFFQEKYLQLIAEDIQLENLMDTKEVISMVDQPGIEPEMLLDIDADTVSDTEMDDASTSESLKLGCPVIQNLLDEDDIGEIFSWSILYRLFSILADYLMLKISAIKPKIVVVSPTTIPDTSFEEEQPLNCQPLNPGPISLMWNDATEMLFGNLEKLVTVVCRNKLSESL